MSEDFTDQNIALLQKVHAYAESTKLILDSASRVQAIGVEGVQAVADCQPELLLEAITRLAAALEDQQELINLLLELWMKANDQSNDIFETIEKILKQ